jgi:hypothetical protein
MTKKEEEDYFSLVAMNKEEDDTKDNREGLNSLVDIIKVVEGEEELSFLNRCTQGQGHSRSKVILPPSLDHIN